MFVHAEVVYGFYMPQDYDELKQFEAETDTSKMKKKEDTIATRYIVTVNATYPYKSKEPQMDTHDIRTDTRECVKDTHDKTEPRKEQNICGKCRYLYRDFKYGLSCYRLMDNEPCKYEERNDEPNSSEKPNNCEHITEDGVTCAKYPACDDCLDNPLNKVKGSERLLIGSEQTEPTISKMEQVETMSCQECKHFHENAVMYLDQCDFCFKDCKYEPKDEPKTQMKTQNSNLTFEKADCPWK